MVMSNYILYQEELNSFKIFPGCDIQIFNNGQ